MCKHCIGVEGKPYICSCDCHVASTICKICGLGMKAHNEKDLAKCALVETSNDKPLGSKSENKIKSTDYRHESASTKGSQLPVSEKMNITLEHFDNCEVYKKYSWCACLLAIERIDKSGKKGLSNAFLTPESKLRSSNTIRCPDSKSGEHYIMGDECIWKQCGIKKDEVMSKCITCPRTRYKDEMHEIEKDYWQCHRCFKEGRYN